MRSSITIDDLNITNNQPINLQVQLGGASSDKAGSNPVLRSLTTEDSENFAKYVDQVGLANEPNILVLSSLHHYYYDADEMTNVKTVVNLKELNQTKQLKDFIHSMFHILPPGCNFIGCFVNNRKQNGFVLGTSPSDFYYKRNSDAIEKGIASSSPFLNMIYNVIDSKTNKYMSERSVDLVLREHGFKVLDMTELDGLTYFCAKSLRTADN
jgi:hypothetical protein